MLPFPLGCSLLAEVSHLSLSYSKERQSKAHLQGRCTAELIRLLSFVIILTVFIFRCNLTLHFSECQEKAVQCTVSGCRTIMRRKSLQEHVVTAASSHAVLQSGEVQRLRGIIHFKVGKASFLGYLTVCVYLSLYVDNVLFFFSFFSKGDQ